MEIRILKSNFHKSIEVMNQANLEDQLTMKQRDRRRPRIKWSYHICVMLATFWQPEWV